MGALDAIRQFLLVAIESQQHFDGIIQTTADSDDEFIRLNGFSKEELKEGVQALKEAIKWKPAPTPYTTAATPYK